MFVSPASCPAAVVELSDDSDGPNMSPPMGGRPRATMLTQTIGHRKAAGTQQLAGEAEPDGDAGDAGDAVALSGGDAPSVALSGGDAPSVSQERGKGKAKTKAKAGPAPKHGAAKKTLKNTEAVGPSAAAAAAEPGQASRTDPQVEKMYVLMKYGSHGTNGTMAIREKKTGKQVMEVNLKNADFSRNSEVARTLCEELNQGKDLLLVKRFLAELKATYKKP